MYNSPQILDLGSVAEHTLAASVIPVGVSGSKTTIVNNDASINAALLAQGFATIPNGTKVP